jgi:hypothetical protein
MSKQLSRKRPGSNLHDRYSSESLKLYEQQEIYDPLLKNSEHQQYDPGRRYGTHLTRIPQDQSPDVAQRHASGESLRQLEKLYGVSHEAVRQVLRKHDYGS